MGYGIKYVSSLTILCKKHNPNFCVFLNTVKTITLSNNKIMGMVFNV